MKIPLLTLEAPHPDRKGSLGLHSFLLLPERIFNYNNTPEVPEETMWTRPYVKEGITEDKGEAVLLLVRQGWPECRPYYLPSRSFSRELGLSSLCKLELG